MKKNMNKLFSIVISFAMIFTCCGYTSAFADETVYVISESGNYTYSESNPVVVKSGVVANITLKDATIITTSQAPIAIENGAEAVITLEGTNTLTAPASEKKIMCAGIYVPTDAKLTIEGNGTLNVTGGYYGAGIGSIELVKAGDITIKSGVINAYGGQRGAGIGSAHQASAGSITINGGTIKAIGREMSAGIGTGYGTSGGGNIKVGDLDGGNITITGGTIYAAPYNADFSKINPLDPICLDHDGSAKGDRSCAAGIGGGYGSSSGYIKITGGNIVAVGTGGGAGIGAGRGASKINKYNKNAYFANIEIGGNAKVLAFATRDNDNSYDGGGAAIGAGRGSHTGGTIKLYGNADITAIASPGASAIGSSSFTSPVDGAIPVAEDISISDNVKLFAASDGTRYAIDTALGTKTYENITSKIQQIKFDSKVLNADEPTTFTLNANNKFESEITVPKGYKSVAVNLNKTGTYYLKSNDLFGVQESGTTEYTSADALTESTCVDLTSYTVPEEPEDEEEIIFANAPISLKNDYAYIYGKNAATIGADDVVTRGEACAMIYRLLKQNDMLGEFNYNKNAESVFADLEGRWDRSAVEYMESVGIFDSNQNLGFPDRPVKRGDAFKIFVCALKMTDRTDLRNAQYAKILLDKGYISGDENGELRINEDMTRAEFCKIYNVITGRDKMGLFDAQGNIVNSGTYGFSDLDESSWYYDIILKATSAYTDGHVDFDKRANKNDVDDYE